MLARDTTAAQEKERCLMGLEDALQACLDKHREAEDRLHDYALYYRLAISFRALSEEDFRQTVSIHEKIIRCCSNTILYIGIAASKP